MRGVQNGLQAGQVHRRTLQRRLGDSVERIRARVAVLRHLLRVEADVAPAVHGEVVEQQARGAALVEQRAGLLEQRVHHVRLVHPRDGVRVGGLQRGDGARRAFLPH